MKNVVLLGSTGSIGTSTVKVAEDLPDRIRLVGLAAGNNSDLLLEQARKHRPDAISITNPAKAKEISKRLGIFNQGFFRRRRVMKLATLPGADIVLIAIVGTAGLQPALAAIRAGKDIAIASKEILVMAGEIVMSEARKYGVRVLAVDSEHSAIFQCLDGKPSSSVRKLWLTASGGPFRDKKSWPQEKFSEITVERALKHPSWVMGRKITIDSATLFNKGLEMIEARWLFDIEMARVGVPGASAKHRPFAGGICGRRAARAAFHAGHVPADSIRAHLSRPRRRANACRPISPDSAALHLKSRIWNGSHPSNWRARPAKSAAHCQPF